MRKLLGVLLLLPTLSWGAISGTVVQCATEDTSSATSMTIDSGDGWSAPTTGNLLVYSLAIRQDITTQPVVTPDATFTEVEEYTSATSFTAGGSVGWAEADSGDTSFTFSLSVDPGWWSITICEIPGTDLDLSAVEASGEDITEVNTNDQTAPSGSATNTSTNALVVYFHMVRASVHFSAGTNTASSGTIQSEPTETNAAGSVIVTEVVSSTGSNSNTVTTTDTGNDKYGAVIIFGEAAASATVSFDATNYALGATVTATATGYSGTLTTLSLTGGDSISANGGASSASATYTVPALAAYVSGGVADNTQWGVSLTGTVAPDNATDTLTIDAPADSSTSDFENAVTCSKGACDSDSVVETMGLTGFAANDDLYCRATDGELDSAGVDSGGVPWWATSTGTLECRWYDESGSVWSATSTIEYTAPSSGEANCEIVKVVVRDLVKELVRAQCQ